jgi:kynureninase
MSRFSDYQPDEAFALQCDAEDPLRHFRDCFHIPCGTDGTPLVYFAGNSLGLQPRGVHERVVQELKDWAELGVDGHFRAEIPWYTYHEAFRESAGRLVGAMPHEVVMMNTLTVNLHLMMVSFFRPTPRRNRVLMEYPAFPSDTYAVKSQLHYHGLSPDDTLVLARPRTGEHVIDTDDMVSLIRQQGGRLALILLGGVNYFTGQVYDMARITQVGHEIGAIVGFDLAHAAGNVPLQLHDWGVDFAVWCHYKYLNSGPGAVAGCYVHERHCGDASRPRFAGWWGNDPGTRFRMHLEPDFIPVASADAWQVSNPPILSLAPVRASLDLFDKAGIKALREKSIQLTGYLRYLIEHEAGGKIEIITPSETQAQGCQLSLLVEGDGEPLFHALQRDGIVCDFRKPNVIRVAPVPLYNSFHDAWRFGQVLKKRLQAR